MANFGPLAAEIGLLVWSTPANFSGFRLLASLLHRRRSTKVNHTLHDVCLSAGLDTIYTFQGLLLSNRILSGAKFTFRPSRSFSYIGSVTARHSSTGRQPNFAVFNPTLRCSAEDTTYIFGRAAITLGIGPHSSFVLRLDMFQIVMMLHSNIWLVIKLRLWRPCYSKQCRGMH